MLAPKKLLVWHLCRPHGLWSKARAFLRMAPTLTECHQKCRGRTRKLTANHAAAMSRSAMLRLVERAWHRNQSRIVFPFIRKLRTATALAAGVVVVRRYSNATRTDRAAAWFGRRKSVGMDG